jgi:hypothetical protein
MLPDPLGLFRTKLLIQILPESNQDFVTFHPSKPPLDASLLLNAAF